MDANHHVNPAVSLEAAGIEDGDHVTAVAIEAKGSGNKTSFRVVLLWR